MHHNTSSSRSFVGGPADSHFSIQNLPFIFSTPIDPTQQVGVAIGGYTDFYSLNEHAANVSTMFCDPKSALLPNRLFGYNGRAGLVVVSSTPVRYPLGQTKAPDAEQPSFSPCRKLDFDGTAARPPCDVGLQHGGRRQPHRLGHEQRPRAGLLRQPPGTDTWNGRRPFDLTGGTRAFLEGGNEVIITGWCRGPGYSVSLGAATGRIMPARGLS